MLLEEFLEPLRITQSELAERIEVPFQRVNGLVNGRRALTPDTALRLARVFGTTPGFWMNHQAPVGPLPRETRHKGGSKADQAAPPEGLGLN